MTTFTPPSHTEYFAGPGQDRLWSRVPYQRSNGVLVNPDTGMVSRYPGDLVLDSDTLIAAEAAGVAFHSGHTYTEVFAPDVEALLISAGYEDLFDDGSYPGWL